MPFSRLMQRIRLAYETYADEQEVEERRTEYHAWLIYYTRPKFSKQERNRMTWEQWSRKSKLGKRGQVRDRSTEEVRVASDRAFERAREYFKKRKPMKA